MQTIPQFAQNQGTEPSHSCFLSSAFAMRRAKLQAPPLQTSAVPSALWQKRKHVMQMRGPAALTYRRERRHADDLVGWVARHPSSPGKASRSGDGGATDAARGEPERSEGGHRCDGRQKKWMSEREMLAKDRPIMKPPRSRTNLDPTLKSEARRYSTDPQPKQSNMKITTALLAIVSATPLAEGFVGNNAAQNVRIQHARFSTTVDISAPSPSASSSTSVSATLPSPEESAQALQDYMVKAHEDKARAVREVEEKSRARIKVRPNVKAICLGLRRHTKYM